MVAFSFQILEVRAQLKHFPTEPQFKIFAMQHFKAFYRALVRVVREPRRTNVPTLIFVLEVRERFKIVTRF